MISKTVKDNSIDNSKNYFELLRTLLGHVFTPKEYASSSKTGKKSRISKESKPQLDETKRNVIAGNI